MCRNYSQLCNGLAGMQVRRYLSKKAPSPATFTAKLSQHALIQVQMKGVERMLVTLNATKQLA